MKRIYLIPKSGLLVLNPDTGRPLAAEGAELVKTTYWLRRIKDGDVLEGKAPAMPKENIESKEA